MNRNQENNPRHAQYWLNKGFSQKEAEENVRYKRRVGSHRCIEYWLAKGFSEDEGRENIRQLQSKCSSNQVSRKPSCESIEKLRNANIKRNQIETWIEEYGEEIGTEKFNEFKKKQSENGKKLSKLRVLKNPNTYVESSVRRVEYWIKKGYSENEAILMVAKHQSRGLDFYVKKYGETEGLELWEKRNEKWFNSFYNDGKDLKEVNQKRRDNAHVGYYTKDTIKGITHLNFYLLIFKDLNNTEFVKYGLTKQKSISKRWRVHLDYEVKLFEQFNSDLALKMEQVFHDNFKKSYRPEVIKTTECFVNSADNYNKAITIIEDFKNGKYSTNL